MLVVVAIGVLVSSIVVVRSRALGYSLVSNSMSDSLHDFSGVSSLVSPNLPHTNISFLSGLHATQDRNLTSFRGSRGSGHHGQTTRPNTAKEDPSRRSRGRSGNTTTSLPDIYGVNERPADCKLKSTHLAMKSEDRTNILDGFSSSLLLVLGDSTSRGVWLQLLHNLGVQTPLLNAIDAPGCNFGHNFVSASVVNKGSSTTFLSAFQYYPPGLEDSRMPLNPCNASGSLVFLKSLHGRVLHVAHSKQIWPQRMVFLFGGIALQMSDVEAVQLWWRQSRQLGAKASCGGPATNMSYTFVFRSNGPNFRRFDKNSKFSQFRAEQLREGVVQFSKEVERSRDHVIWWDELNYLLSMKNTIVKDKCRCHFPPAINSYLASTLSMFFKNGTTGLRS